MQPNFRDENTAVKRPGERVRCSTCMLNWAARKGECGTCAEYRRRTGRRRPDSLAERQAQLNWIAEERRHAKEIQERLRRQRSWARVQHEDSRKDIDI